MKRWLLRHAIAVVIALGVALIVLAAVFNERASVRFREFRRTHRCTPVGASHSGYEIAWVCDDGSTWTVETER